MRFAAVRVRREGAVERGSRIDPLTDTTISGKRIWRLTAAVWDLPTFAILAAVSVLVAAYAPFTILALVMILVWIVYFVLLTATSGRPRYPDYPWYLAWKAGRSKSFTGYWYGKFRHRLARYVSRTFRSSAGSLLVQLHSLETGPPEAARLTADQVPGTRLLLRAFRLKNNQPFLKGEKAQISAIKAQVKALRDSLKTASTFGDGYLRYLIDIYFGFTVKQRELIQAQHEPTILERLDESPTLQKLFLFFVGVAVSIFVYGVLRLSGIPLPAVSSKGMESRERRRWYGPTGRWASSDSYSWSWDLRLAWGPPWHEVFAVTSGDQDPDTFMRAGVVPASTSIPPQGRPGLSGTCRAAIHFSTPRQMT